MSDYDIYAAMQEGKEPLARYGKTIVGKVHVTVLNPFSDTPEGVILSGDNSLPKAQVSLWTSKQVVFFETVNKPQIDGGRLIKISKPVEVPKSPNIISEEEIDEVLNDKFLTLRSKLATFTDIAPVLRILNRARELEKSEKIIKHIEQRLSDLEMEKYEG